MGEEIGLVLDGSAILLVALGLWLSLPRRSWAGVLFGVVGLAMMAGTATLRAYPNPSRAALQQTAAELRAEIADITGKWKAAEGAAEALRRDVARLAKQVEETEARLASVGRELAEKRAEAERTRSDALLRLKTMMSEGLTTKFYRIAVLPDRELIAGKVGTYFSIRLNDGGTGGQFIFPKGRYTISASEGAIVEAAQRMASDILAAFDGLAEYRLFVRGGADAEPLAGAGDLLPEFATVAYLPLAGAGQYATETEEQSFHAPINNSDLPLLRGAYFRSIIASGLPARAMDVLNNMPSKQIAEEYRTVELILYVK
jgi:hypothetical protein